jgi:hypothetical protein
MDRAGGGTMRWLLEKRRRAPPGVYYGRSSIGSVKEFTP